MAPIEPDKRRRLQILTVALVAAVLFVAGLTVAFTKIDDSDRLEASSSATTTTRGTTLGVVVSTTQPPPTIAPAATATTRRSTRRTTTTTVPTSIAPPEEFAETSTGLVCAQTTKSEPAPPRDDWALYWTTKPKNNDALDLVICVEDLTPKVGTTVKLYVLAQDPDAEVFRGPCDIFVTWDSNAGSECREGAVAPPADPKPTPKETPGKVTMTFIHEYSEPGEWIVDVSAWSTPEDGDPNPYASYNSIELRLDVHR